MPPGINILVCCKPDDDGLFHFKISLSNGDVIASLDCWGGVGEFRELGERLADFPKDLEDVVTYESSQKGRDSKGEWASVLQLNVFCYSRAGGSAMKVNIDNYDVIPRLQRNDFFIVSEPSSLNSLGYKLKRWNPDEECDVTWVAY